MSRDGGEALPPRRPKAKPVEESNDFEEEAGEIFHAAPKDFSKKKRSGLDLDNPKAVLSQGPTLLERILFGSVSSAQLAAFCRQLGAYLDAGIDMFRAYSSLEKQFARTALGPVIKRLALSIRAGDDLPEALAREPQVFDPHFLSQIRVAATRGGAPETLRKLAAYYESRQRMIRQARSAMIYPVAVLLIASAVVAFLSFVILPIFASFLERGQHLPGPALFLISYSRFMRDLGWWVIPTVVIVSVIAIRRSYRTPPGKAAIDELCLHIPVFGKILRKLDIARFARSLSSLLEAGVDPISSLQLTKDVMRMAPYRRALEGAISVVRDGGELSEALYASRRFDHDVMAFVETGEETGKLPENLHRLADEYEEQVSHIIKNLGVLIQPIITIAIGGLVLFIAVAMVMTIVTMMQSAMTL